MIKLDEYLIDDIYDNDYDPGGFSSSHSVVGDKDNYNIICIKIGDDKSWYERYILYFNRKALEDRVFKKVMSNIKYEGYQMKSKINYGSLYRLARVESSDSEYILLYNSDDGNEVMHRDIICTDNYMDADEVVDFLIDEWIVSKEKIDKTYYESLSESDLKKLLISEFCKS